LREHLRAEITALTVGLFDKAESLPERLRSALAAANPLGREADAGRIGTRDGHDAQDAAPARPVPGLLGAIQDEEDRERLSR
ncbi:hydrolase, partial [Xanthomonas citri pv. citri]|nr:hydrolase [Xanthomonas citri pv. citri]